MTIEVPREPMGGSASPHGRLGVCVELSSSSRRALGKPEVVENLKHAFRRRCFRNCRNFRREMLSQLQNIRFWPKSAVFENAGEKTTGKNGGFDRATTRTTDPRARPWPAHRAPTGTGFRPYGRRAMTCLAGFVPFASANASWHRRDEDATSVCLPRQRLALVPTAVDARSARRTARVRPVARARAGARAGRRPRLGGAQGGKRGKPIRPPPRGPSPATRGPGRTRSLPLPIRAPACAPRARARARASRPWPPARRSQTCAAARCSRPRRGGTRRRPGRSAARSGRGSARTRARGRGSRTCSRRPRRRLPAAPTPRVPSVPRPRNAAGPVAGPPGRASAGPRARPCVWGSPRTGRSTRRRCGWSWRRRWRAPRSGSRRGRRSASGRRGTRCSGSGACTTGPCSATRWSACSFRAEARSRRRRRPSRAPRTKAKASTRKKQKRAKENFRNAPSRSAPSSRSTGSGRATWCPWWRATSTTPRAKPP